MKVLVSDTSILIDLERGGFLDAVFLLPFEFAVPDVLYEQELAGEWGDQLRNFGLRVEEISAEGLANALKYRANRSVLSLPDSFALALAHERNWMLLTGDRQLRQLAIEEKVACHGILWLLDHLEELQKLPLTLLLEGLEALARHPRCRLPRSDIAVRLERNP